MGPVFSLNSTFCPTAFKISKISEKTIAASKLNLFIGCSEASVASFTFRQKLIKFLFFLLIFWYSGSYLTACLKNHIGKFFFLFKREL